MPLLFSKNKTIRRLFNEKVGILHPFGRVKSQKKRIDPIE